jgi:hypothetical protein
MLRRVCALILLGFSLRTPGAERRFDFTDVKPGERPEGWLSLLAGHGRPSEWVIKMEDVPPSIAPFNAQARNINQQPVLTQINRDPEDERFPIVLFDSERFGDFTFRVRFKIAGGAIEQIAGVVFRAQDEKNFYVARVSALGKNLRFYKFVDGQRSTPLGPDLEIEKGRWYELMVAAEGNRIQIKLDGREVMPSLTDSSFAIGKIGLLTKSDSVAFFADPIVTYKPLESLANALVRETIERQPRLLNLRVYARSGGEPALRVVAAKEHQDLGLKAEDTDERVFKENRTYFGKTKESSIVTAALHDRNGEVAGVVKFYLRTYPGQTEAAAIARVLPTIAAMEKRVGAARDLTE